MKKSVKLASSDSSRNGVTVGLKKQNVKQKQEEKQKNQKRNRWKYKQQTTQINKKR